MVTENHPLLPIGGISGLLSDKGRIGSSTSSSSRSSSVAALDPLSIAFDGIDPLSQFAIESEREAGSEKDQEVVPRRVNQDAKAGGASALSQMESWSSRRAAILNKYTTTERLSIVTSFLTGGETSEWP